MQVAAASLDGPLGLGRTHRYDIGNQVDRRNGSLAEVTPASRAFARSCRWIRSATPTPWELLVPADG